jgi:hypothetical protein
LGAGVGFTASIKFGLLVGICRQEGGLVFGDDGTGAEFQSDCERQVDPGFDLKAVESFDPLVAGGFVQTTGLYERTERHQKSGFHRRDFGVVGRRPFG